MGDRLIDGMITIATALIGVAILAVIVSRSANTSGVLQAAGGALATDLQAAVSPVTGGMGGGLNAGFTGGAPIQLAYA